MARKLHTDAAACACCGRVGPAWADLDDDEPLPLCDGCEYARRRWEAWAYSLAHPGAGYPFADGPPKSPPVRR